MKDISRHARRVFGSEGARRAANACLVAVSLAVAALAGRWLARVGFPLAHADPVLAAAAGGCFLFAAVIKACGWSFLFAPDERPRTTTLAAAGGAAALAGVALPGRFDDALRIAVVRRFASARAAVGATALSLFALGLVDTIALTPLASTAAASGGSLALRAGLCVVAAAGIGAMGFLLMLPRWATSARLVRFRLSRWVNARWPSARQSLVSVAYVLAAWLTRGVGTYLLLTALGLRISFPLALVFMCAGAAAGALPIAPAGAITQAGAGAPVLLATGASFAQALQFAVAAQLVTVMVGGAVMLAAIAEALARPRARA